MDKKVLIIQPYYSYSGELLEQEIPHDLFKAKNQDYRLVTEVVTFIYRYIKDQRQNSKIISICSMFLIVLYEVPQGSTIMEKSL